VFEPTLGNKVLVGGGLDGTISVIDDQTGTFVPPPNTVPPGTFRPALIDFQNPDANHLVVYCDIEISDPTMAFTVNYYLDPSDVDNPWTPIKLNMAQIKKTNKNRFRGFFGQNNLGSLCNRILIEFLVTDPTSTGVIRSIMLAADPASALSTT
jgi:hypothetical protein